MEGLKNLISDAHGVTAGLLIAGATLLAALGIMPLETWTSYTQVIFGLFAGSHALISGADAFASRDAAKTDATKNGPPNA